MTYIFTVVAKSDLHTCSNTWLRVYSHIVVNDFLTSSGSQMYMFHLCRDRCRTARRLARDCCEYKIEVRLASTNRMIYNSWEIVHSRGCNTYRLDECGSNENIFVFPWIEFEIIK